MIDRIALEFEKFDAENPSVMKELVALARKAKKTGVMHYGIGALFEILRWHRRIEKGDREFKLNNNHRALYARRIMELFPDKR